MQSTAIPMYLKEKYKFTNLIIFETLPRLAHRNSSFPHLDQPPILIIDVTVFKMGLFC